MRFGPPILLAGLVATGMGALLVIAAGQVDGLIWLAVPISLLGLVLLGMWVREYLRPPAPPDTPESVAASLPGKWYPFALFGIVLVQVVWIVIWSKL